MKHLLLLLVLSLVPISAHSNKDNDHELVFGLYSSEKPSWLIKKYTPIIELLERRLREDTGVDYTIEIKITKTYSEALEAFVKGDFDLVRFGPVSYVQAKQKNPDISIAAVELTRDVKEYYGIIIVNENSTIKDIADIEGKSFAFGDEASSVGRYLSQQFLRKNGISGSDLSDITYLGRYDLVGNSIGNEEYEVGAITEAVFKSLIERGVEIKELTRFPSIARPWIFGAYVNPEVKNSIQMSLLEVKDHKSLSLLNINGFAKGNEDEYTQIKSAIENIYLFEDD